MTNDDDDYKVGYKNPPIETRFKPGQSGNPKGRPKDRQKNVLETLNATLQKKIMAIENGKKISMTKLEAFWIGLVNGAIGGDKKDRAALARFLPLLEKGGEDQMMPEEYPTVVILHDIPRPCSDGTHNRGKTK
jgi:hypothetical protein